MITTALTRTGRKCLRRGAVALAVAVCAVVVAQGLTAAEPAGTLLLFDGKTLDGWKTSFDQGGENRVEDGILVMKTGKPMSGVTSTRKDLLTTNYELSYEAIRRKGSDFFAAATFPVGMSFITLVNGGWGGNITGLSSLDGSDASENETGTYVKYKNDTWYRFRVRVTGQAICAWIDDKKVVAVNYKERRVDTRLETDANHPLGFATWESEGAVRKVTMRALSPDEVATTDKLAPGSP
jgi:hypothetical protein